MASFLHLGPSILNGSPHMGLRKMEKGYLAYAPTNTVAASATDPLLLSFPLQVSDPNFFNYTAINFDPLKILYVHSDQATDGIIDMSKAESLPLQNSRFPYSIAIEKQRTLKAIHLLGPTGVQQTLPLPQLPYSDSYLIDLTGEPAGRYEIQFSFEEESENYSYAFFAASHAFPQSPLAIFEWKQPLNETNGQAPTYTLAFKALSTYWRYIFMGIADNQWDQVEISSIEVEGQRIDFTKEKEKMVLPDGSATFTAISTAPIPLQERPEWKVRLQTPQIPDGMILPSPQTSNLPADTQKENAAPRSDIYCYL